MRVICTIPILPGGDARDTILAHHLERRQALADNPADGEHFPDDGEDQQRPTSA